MGSVCSSNIPTTEIPENNFDFVYDQDKYQNRVNHDDSIIFKDKHISQNIETTQAKLKKSGRLYKDPTMRSDPIVLKATNGRDFQVSCTFQRPYVFIRDPQAAKNKKYQIFNTKDSNPSQIIVRDEVMQYFGVFLCFLAENPHLIDKIILTESNSYGINVVSMNVLSKKEYVYIDDYILCYQKRPLFCQPAKGIYTWPCLLQKAWFKIKGNVVKKIQKNSPEEVIHAFLSFPTQRIRLHSADHTYNILELVKNLKYKQAEKGTIVTSKKQPSHKLGISGRKHFYLLKVFSYNQKNLLYLRNPCGLFDFRGIYSVIPPDLAQLIKRQTGEERIPDGNFILEDEQFLQQIQEFLIIDYSSVSEHISQTSVDLDFGEEQFIKFDLKDNAITSVSYSQSGYKNKDDVTFLPITFQIVSLNDNQIVSELNDHEGCFGASRVNLLPKIYQNLKAGSYLIRIKKKSPNSTQYTKLTQIGLDKIIVTAPFAVEFDVKNKEDYKRLFNSFLVAKGKKELAARNPRSKRLKEEIEHVAFWLGDLAVIYVQQTDFSKAEIKLQVRFPDLQNLQCQTQRLSKQYTCLEPFQGYLLLIFEKINLIEQTVLGKYLIEAF